MNIKLSHENKEFSRLGIFSLITIAATVTATILRIVSLLFFYDKIGYYRTGEAIPVISNVFYAISLVFFALSTRFAITSRIAVAPPSKIARAAALLPMSAILFDVITRTSELFSLSGSGAKWYEILFPVFGIISVVFFASLAFCRQPSSLTSLSGIGCILWFAVVTMSSYLDFTVPMNSPDKLFFHLSAVGIMFFIFSEIRALYRMLQPRMYVFSVFTAVFAIAVDAIPNIIGDSRDIFASYSLIKEDITMIALLVYIVVRFITGLSEKSMQSEIYEQTEEISSEHVEGANEKQEFKTDGTDDEKNNTLYQ